MATDQEAGFERYRRPTKRDVFLATMEETVPWQELCAVIEPHYPKAGNGRPPIGLGRMMRMYFMVCGRPHTRHYVADEVMWPQANVVSCKFV